MPATDVLTMTDLFCGGGGSSVGAAQTGLIRTTLAANHWRLAVDTHQLNHPDADHDCADLSQVDPRRYRRTHLLWASPECVNHSQARRAAAARAAQLGLSEEAAERSRATMWDVVRFTEHHLYDAVIVENVVDARNWLPFNAWLSAMHSYGYQHQIVWLNSMHAQAAGPGAAQSRDRMYVVFWRTGIPTPNFDAWLRPPAWCGRCEHVIPARQVFKRQDRPAWGRYRAQYLYRCPNAGCGAVVEPDVLPAASVLDWTLPATRIRDRSTPLRDRTMTRIEAGIAKHGNVALTIPVEGRDGVWGRPVTGPLRTQTARNETGILIPPGFVMRNNGSRGTGGEHCTSLAEPVRTLTTAGHQSLVTWQPSGTRPRAADCQFRMFEPHEVAAAMAFPDGYQLLGSKRERTRLAGNAVTPPAARDLVSATAGAVLRALSTAA